MTILTSFTHIWTYLHLVILYMTKFGAWSWDFDLLTMKLLIAYIYSPPKTQESSDMALNQNLGHSKNP